MKFVKPALPATAISSEIGESLYLDCDVRDYAEAYLQAYLAAREPVAWAYRAFPESAFVTLTQNVLDTSVAIEGTIKELYE